jgi:uncharacterized protein (UPF0276 family)
LGLGWRLELAAGLLAHLDRIDVIEVIADDYFEAARADLRALRTLAAQVSMVLHGTSLGLASTVPVACRRLDRIARLIEAADAEGWSEHLAFVRSGSIEIGHLAAPPRTEASIEGACRNIDRATRIIGCAPLVENIATLVVPPTSELDEAEWTTGIVGAAGVSLLLDLHNLYANALNFGDDPLTVLARFPIERVAQVHLSGGHWIDGPGGARRLLDDYLHDVPLAVFELLRELGRLASQPLTVIIERDGRFPPIARLIEQLDLARAALAAGRKAARRARRLWRNSSPGSTPTRRRSRRFCTRPPKPLALPVSLRPRLRP